MPLFVFLLSIRSTMNMSDGYVNIEVLKLMLNPNHYFSNIYVEIYYVDKVVIDIKSMTEVY